jgi:hypothetical protein
MPLRMAVILFGLFVGCVATVLVAWAIGSEFYVLVPTRWLRAVSRPPTHPCGVLVFLAACVALYLYSPRYALLYFTVLLGSVVLGSLVGYGVFNWKPTLMQVLLTLAMTAEAVYGWSIQGYYLDD